MEQMEKWEKEKNCAGMLCDVRVRETVDHVIRKSIEHWGHIDVIAKYVTSLQPALYYHANPRVTVAPAMVCLLSFADNNV